MLKRDTIDQQIKASEMQLIDEQIIAKEGIKSSNKFIFEKLKIRCLELISKYPDKHQLFENYIKKQNEENEILENEVVCSTFVIKKK
jgi:hypothetical protein